jgi:predicted N-acyltransferase
MKAQMQEPNLDFAPVTTETNDSPIPSTPASMSIASLSEIEQNPIWKQAFPQQRKDGRYYKIVEETLHQGFKHIYFVLNDSRGRSAIQPAFIHDQDILAGSPMWLQRLAGRVRKIFPRFLTMKTLMVGCAAGEGRLDSTDPGHCQWIGQILAENLTRQARALRCGMIVMKEFHFETRSALACMTEHAFTRVPSLPMTKLNIHYKDFEEYMSRALSKVTRKSLRRKFKATAESQPIAREVTSDVSHCIDEIYPLYIAVYDRSPLHFEKLTKEFLVRLGREMADKVRYFIWRQNGKAVAFSLCMVSGQTIYDEYLGLDYSVALDLHLYFHTLRDTIQWAMDNGLHWYCSSALNYDPKLHLRCKLEPLDLYVSHTSRLINFFLARFLPWLEPTRNDKTLKQFENYNQLWND